MFPTLRCSTPATPTQRTNKTAFAGKPNLSAPKLLFSGGDDAASDTFEHLEYVRKANPASTAREIQELKSKIQNADGDQKEGLETQLDELRNKLFKDAEIAAHRDHELEKAAIAHFDALKDPNNSANPS